MTEAWLLIDEPAIRRAADDPNGTTRLDFPPLRKLESTPDPKTVLKGCLLDASELRGRRRDQLERGLSRRVQRLAALIPDFSPLRRLGLRTPARRAARLTATARGNPAKKTAKDFAAPGHFQVRNRSPRSRRNRPRSGRRA